MTNLLRLTLVDLKLTNLLKLTQVSLKLANLLKLAQVNLKLTNILRLASSWPQVGSSLLESISLFLMMWQRRSQASSYARKPG